MSWRIQSTNTEHPVCARTFYTRAAVHSELVFSRTRIPAAGQQGGRIPVHIPGVPLGAVYRLPLPPTTAVVYRRRRRRRRRSAPLGIRATGTAETTVFQIPPPPPFEHPTRVPNTPHPPTSRRKIHVGIVKKNPFLPIHTHTLFKGVRSVTPHLKCSSVAKNKLLIVFD